MLMPDFSVPGRAMGSGWTADDNGLITFLFHKAGQTGPMSHDATLMINGIGVGGGTPAQFYMWALVKKGDVVTASQNAGGWLSCSGTFFKVKDVKGDVWPDWSNIDRTNRMQSSDAWTCQEEGYVVFDAHNNGTFGWSYDIAQAFRIDGVDIGATEVYLGAGEE